MAVKPGGEMKIAVVGMWHLGTVTAACLADAGFHVVGVDTDSKCIENLRTGKPPLFEPGLEELIKKNLNDQLTFTSDVSVVSDCELIWITYDTPVDDDDVADVSFVEREVANLFPFIKNETIVLTSSQLPVGTTSKMTRQFQQESDKNVSFCYSPENLRLGNAINVFSKADRIIAGINSDKDKVVLESVFSRFSDNIIWMSVPSAEMTKHAINAFLATSVVFINEIAVLCEHVGADASEVEKGLKSESRIGPKAYLKPGTSFAGGTLARDISYLVDKGKEFELPSILFKSVRRSNDSHKSWIYDKLIQIFGNVKNRRISILGLAYKPGTDTLRRSSAVELCERLLLDGAILKAFDPAIKELPIELQASISYCRTLEDAILEAEALVICTEWPDFKKADNRDLILESAITDVIDPNNFLSYLDKQPSINHVVIGKSL